MAIIGTWHVHAWIVCKEVEGPEIDTKHLRRHSEASIQRSIHLIAFSRKLTQANLQDGECAWFLAGWYDKVNA